MTKKIKVKSFISILAEKLKLYTNNWLPRGRDGEGDGARAATGEEDHSRPNHGDDYDYDDVDDCANPFRKWKNRGLDPGRPGPHAISWYKITPTRSSCTTKTQRIASPEREREWCGK